MLSASDFQKETCRITRFPLLTYLPADYDPAKTYPLVVFLHGAGERGSDPERIKIHPLPKHMAEGKEFPFIMIAPQCPANCYWGCFIPDLNVLLDEVLEQYPVDPDRVYLTGLSMGGTGTWLWLLANPERFAAAAPVCGSGITWYADRIVEKPVWAFHGDADAIVPCYESEHMIEALHRLGGQQKLTIFPGIAHNAWDYAYTEELIEWLLSQHR